MRNLALGQEEGGSFYRSSGLHLVQPHANRGVLRRIAQRSARLLFGFTPLFPDKLPSPSEERTARRGAEGEVTEVPARS
jgi:hypothetical protein